MKDNVLYDRSTSLPDMRGHFHRPRIDGIILSALERNLIAVTAGAGWGKTQAVSQFMRSSGIDFMWLQFSRLDNYTVRFWENFIYAVGLRKLDIASRLSAFGFPDSAALFHNFLHIFAELTTDRDKLMFVFDDVHLINNPSILSFIENLMYARLKNLTIILIGRAIPDLLLQDTGNEPYHITEEELGFTKKEARDYLDGQGLILSDSIFDEIYAGTVGWVSALYLIGLSLKEKGGGSSDLLPVIKWQIFELIDKEIFSKYTEETRRTLAGWAIFERIPEDFIKQDSNRGLNHMKEIEKINFFIRYNLMTRTYDIHHLFLDFLQKKQAEYLSDGEIKEGHLKAADWHHKNGNEMEALAHYQKCGNHEKTWDIIKKFEVQIPAETAKLLLDIIESFPDEFVEKYPLTRVQHARLYLNTGEIMKSLEEFMRILNKYESMPLTKENKKVLGESYLFMAMTSLLLFNYKFKEYFKKADEYLPEGSTLIDNRASFGDGYFKILIKDPVPGELDRYVDAIMESLPYGARAMHGAGYGSEYTTQAEAAYYVGDMKRAESCAYQAIYYSRQKDQYDTICFAYFILLQIHVGAGNYVKAEECLGELNQLLEQAAKDPEKEKYLKNCVYTWTVLESWYYSRLGRGDKIPGWILKEEAKRETYYQIDVFVKAYCLLENEKYAELTAFLESLDIYYSLTGLLVAKLHIQIFKSVSTYKTGDILKSVAALKAAYELAHANSLIMPFIELGRHMRAVINAVKQSKLNKIPDDWLDDIYAKAATYEKHLNHVKSQYYRASGFTPEYSVKFTKREKELLGYLCQGLTNMEIASECFITISAVKKSFNKIYMKLGATNRTDAVRIAIQMELDR